VHSTKLHISEKGNDVDDEESSTRSELEMPDYTTDELNSLFPRSKLSLHRANFPRKRGACASTTTYST